MPLNMLHVIQLLARKEIKNGIVALAGAEKINATMSHNEIDPII
jgi:hypothetical protein